MRNGNGSDALPAVMPLTAYAFGGIFTVSWEVEYTDEFERWWDVLTEDEQVAVDATVRLLERFGPALPFPHSSRVRGARTRHLRELRIQHAGRPIRVLYAFDSRRVALLLLGGEKSKGRRWYTESVARADAIYEAHVAGRKGGEDDDGEEIP